MQRSKKHTLINMRRVPMERKTALAGGMVELFSAKFTAATALFSAEVVPSRPLGGCNLASIAKTRGGRGGSYSVEGMRWGSGFRYRRPFFPCRAQCKHAQLCSGEEIECVPRCKPGSGGVSLHSAVASSDVFEFSSAVPPVCFQERA